MKISKLITAATAALTLASCAKVSDTTTITGTVVPEGLDNVNIVIPDGDLGSAALIYSGYKLADDLHGSIGVLGPYRLDYSNIIPMLEYFSSSLENMLKSNRFDR